MKASMSELEQHVQVLELQAMAAAALSAAGFPPDLTRAPRPEEIASRTSYAAMEDANLRVAHQVADLAREARRLAIALVDSDLTVAQDVPQLLARLDELAAVLRPLPGAGDLVEEITGRAYTHLVDAASAAMNQFVADAARAGVKVQTRAALTPGSLAALDAQARRLASEAVAAGVRAARGVAYTTRRNLPVVAFHQAVITGANDVGTKGLEDVAHQASLRATGAGRMDSIDNVDDTGTGVSFYASELLDRHTCGPCADIDGAQLTAAEAEEAYPGGQYVGCLGGSRCRGTVVAVADTETKATKARPG